MHQQMAIYPKLPAHHPPSPRRSGTFQHAVSQLRQPIQNILLFEWRPDPPFTLVPPHEATHDTPASLSWRVSRRLCCCAHCLLAACRRHAITANFCCRILLVAKRAGDEALGCRQLWRCGQFGPCLGRVASQKSRRRRTLLEGSHDLQRAPDQRLLFCQGVLP